MATPENNKTGQKKNSPNTTAETAAPTKKSMLSYGVQPYQPKEGEAYMSDGQSQHFRKLLQLWRAALLQGGDETIADLQGGEAPSDISDLATLEEVFALKLRTRDRERKLINKIDEAIANIDSKEYGYCEECGVEIGIRRLEARPTATLCIDCKMLDEVREKQRR